MVVAIYASSFFLLGLLVVGCFPKAIIWPAWCPFSYAGTILSAWGHPGGPWEQQEGHVEVRSKIFSDFGLISGLHFESFLGPDGLNSLFFWSLFPGSFLHPFSNGIIDSWGS